MRFDTKPNVELNGNRRFGIELDWGSGGQLGYYEHGGPDKVFEVRQVIARACVVCVLYVSVYMYNMIITNVHSNKQVTIVLVPAQISDDCLLFSHTKVR